MVLARVLGMAFLWKHPESKYFMARFVDLNGKRRNRSTRSTNRKEAQKIADAYEAATRKRRTAQQVREVITELHEEITGEKFPSQTFRYFAEAWLDRKQPEVSEATSVSYQKTVSKFTAFLLERADADITEITSDDILRFRNHEAKTLTPKTVNRYLKCLRMLFKAARQDKVITENPSEFVSATKKATTKARRPFTIAELQSLMVAADDEWKSMIRFGLYTGQRLGDIARLKWGNIDLVKGEIRLVAQKTNKSSVLPIAAPLKQHIQSLRIQSGRDVPVHARASAIVDKQGRSANLSNQFSDLLAKTGLRKKASRSKVAAKAGRGAVRETGELSFHCLRHTAVTMMKDPGAPEAAVMELVGHDSEQMSAHYTHVGQDALKKAAAMLPVI
jgi:integrase